MKYLLISILALLLAGCSRDSGPAIVSAGAPAKPSREASNLISLDEKTQAGAGIRTAVAAAVSQPETIRATGRISENENRTWRVGAITDGRVMTVKANPGDSVKQGDVLAFLHSHDVHESRADYAKAVRELSRLKNVAAYSRRVRDRAKRLYELKAGSLEHLEQAETEMRNAETAVSNGETEVERTRNHLTEFLGINPDEPEHHAAGAHDGDDDWIPVRAPAAGTVVSRKVSQGTVVSPSTEMFVISDLATLWAIAEVNQQSLSQLRLGMGSRIMVQAYPDHAFSGRIARLGDVLDPETRTVQVRVELTNPKGLLKPEMYATVEIAAGKSTAAIYLPQESVQEVRGATVVFVKRDPSHFEARLVESGHAIDGKVEIVRGLKAEETVVIAGAFVVKSEFLKASLAEE